MMKRLPELIDTQEDGFCLLLIVCIDGTLAESVQQLLVVGRDFLTFFMLTASGDNGYEEFERIKCIKQAVFVDVFLEICTKGEIGGRIHTGRSMKRRERREKGKKWKVFSLVVKGTSAERLSFHYLATFTV